MDLDALSKELEKAIGSNDEAAPVSYLNTGYSPLNKIITGTYTKGIPQGRIIEMYGPSSSGKTVLAQMWMIEAQRQGGVAMFNDHEKAFMEELGIKMGLDTTFPRWIYKRPRTWEESNTHFLKAAELIRRKGAIAPEAPIICVLDSVAAAIPQSQLFDKDGNERGIDTYTMNDTTAMARVASTTLKAVNDLTAQLNVTMIYLNQIRTKPGVIYGDPSYTPGGAAFEFYASLRLALTRSKLNEGKGADKEMIGQEIKITTKKNKLNRPFLDTTLRFMFNEDGSARFDPTFSLIEYLVEIGRLAVGKPGSVVWTNGKQYTKGQLAEMIDKVSLQKELIALLPEEPVAA